MSQQRHGREAGNPRRRAVKVVPPRLAPDVEPTATDVADHLRDLVTLLRDIRAQLAALATLAEARRDSKELLTVDVAAERLSLGRDAVFRLLAMHPDLRFKSGASTRVKARALSDWLATAAGIPGRDSEEGAA